MIIYLFIFGAWCKKFCLNFLTISLNANDMKFCSHDMKFCMNVYEICCLIVCNLADYKAGIKK